MAGFAEAILLRRKYAVMKDAAGPRPPPMNATRGVSPHVLRPLVLAVQITHAARAARIQHYR